MKKHAQYAHGDHNNFWNFKVCFSMFRKHCKTFGNFLYLFVRCSMFYILLLRNDTKRCRELPTVSRCFWNLLKDSLKFQKLRPVPMPSTAHIALLLSDYSVVATLVLTVYSNTTPFEVSSTFSSFSIRRLASATISTWTVRFWLIRQRHLNTANEFRGPEPQPVVMYQIKQR